MAKLVKPKVFLLGFTDVHEAGLRDYLKYTGQDDFWDTYRQARDEGISAGEALCSVYAKMCYKSLVVGKNSNISRVRDVRNNLESCHDTAHGSVFEHCQLNFAVTDCSRVYTHEQVRHRPGWAYSQTSGRYCRLDSIDLVWDSCLDPVKTLWLKHLETTEDLVYLTECKLGLRKPNPANPAGQPEAYIEARDCVRRGVLPADGAEPYRWVPDDAFNFDKRKAITSAVRRIAPNGQANEIGMSCNIRALRQVVQVRTARFAEVEIRDVYNQVYDLVREKFPTIFYRARTREVNGFREVYGMKTQPYEIQPGDPKALEFWTSEDLHAEIARREAAGPTAAA